MDATLPQLEHPLKRDAPTGRLYDHLEDLFATQPE